MEETQTGWVAIILVIFINVLIFFLNQDTAQIVFVLLISIVVLSLFYKLTIKVDHQYVRFSFGIGLIHGKYKVDQVINSKPVDYFPLGWGIRWRPGVTIYNVSGTRAVELELKNKKRKVWLGTNEPEKISNYINTVKS